MEKFKEMPKWVQCMPVVIILLIALLIGSMSDLKNAKAALSVAVNNASLVDETQPSPSPAFGKITYKEARALYDQLKNPVWDTGMFYKKTFDERMAYIEEAKKLADKFEVFGTPSQCKSAGLSRIEYIWAMHNFASAKEGLLQINDWNDFTHPMFNAFTFGDHVGGCYDEVETLDIKL